MRWWRPSSCIRPTLSARARSVPARRHHLHLQSLGIPAPCRVGRKSADHLPCTEESQSQCQNTDIIGFLYVLGPGRGNIAEKPQRTCQYNHAFHTFKQDQIQYRLEIADIPAIDGIEEMCINIISFAVEENGLYPIYPTKKAFDKRVELLYPDEL